MLKLVDVADILADMADKSALMSLLRAQPDRWLSAAEIHAALGAVPDRTLRNWLTGLIESGDIESRGERKGRRYRSRSRPVLITPGAGAIERTAELARIATPSIFSAANEILIEHIVAPIYTRPPATYKEDWLEGYVPNESAYLAEPIRHELASLGKWPPVYGRPGTYVRKIYDRLLIDLSYNSSRLEGNTYSLADTERLVMQGEAAPGKQNAERIMILNHKEAIRYLIDHIGTLEVSEESIRTLHYLLADSLVAVGAAGQIRDDSVRITGTTYAPLEGRERLTRLLLRVIEKARAIRDPFEQSLFLLVHLSYLQPFTDVNKRTARLASIIPLIRGDYVPQSFVEVDEGSYLKATIVVYELNAVGPLAEVYAWSYRRSCQRYDVQAHAVGFDEIAALYRPQRRALVTRLVREHVPRAQAALWLGRNIPPEIEPRHSQKFIADALAEVEHLDASRIGGLGITREELNEWQRL